MIRLWGTRYSVYVRIVRMALAERTLAHDHVELDPFDRTQPNPHPFGRVPMLDHDGTRLFETAAITTYLETAFPGPSWTPENPLARARVEQVISIVDSYAYWPMVREVFGNAVFGPATGQEADPDLLRLGLAASHPVLDELETIAAETRILDGTLTRADLHLAPMIDYFVAWPEARDMLTARPRLSAWFATISRRPSFIATAPGLP